MREPVVTANWSRDAILRFEGGGGLEMWVIGDECCDGSRRSSEAKDCQYFCSYVRFAGPAGSFVGCRSWTSAAIVGVGGVKSADEAFDVVELRRFETFWWSGPCTI